MSLIGIFGGTFDPVHYGHLRSAQEIKRAGLDEVCLLPCWQPPHRTDPIATPEQRLSMLELAVIEFPELSIDQRDFARPGPSFMVDSLASLHHEIPGASLALIVGWDAYLGLESWHRWQELLNLAHLIVIGRPGSSGVPTGVLGDLFAKARVNSLAELAAATHGRILRLETTPQNVSATAVRQAFAQNRHIEGVVPTVVLDYIEQQGLYRSR